MFVDYCFDASNLAFGRRHLGFLKPDVATFTQEGGAEEDDVANADLKPNDKPSDSIVADYFPISESCQSWGALHSSQSFGVRWS